MTAARFVLTFTLLASVALAAAPTAAAHKTVFSEDGKIKIVWGFLNEPAVTWTKTGLDLILSDNETGAPISGATDTLEAHLLHGDDELHFENFRAQHGKPGAYTDVVTLTKPGIYILKLHGTINGSAVDIEIPSAHEIHGVEETFFPAVPESPYEEGDGSDDAALLARIATLETEVAALKAQAQTQSQTPATVTPQPSPAVTNDTPLGALLVAVGLVGAALVLRRR